MAKERLHYIDVFKGICIILVVIHHSPLALNGGFAPPGTFLWLLNNFIIAFFMPAFFVATGYCSNFSKPFKIFLWQNIKSILIPCYCLYYLNRYLQNLNVWLFDDDRSWLTLSHWLAPGLRTFIEGGGFYWFLSSMFLAKVLMWGLASLKSNKVKVCASLVLMIVGVCLYQYKVLPNYFFYQHALIFVPFLLVGQLVNENDQFIGRYIKYLVLPFVLIILFLSVFHVEIPTVTRNITVKLTTLPLFLLLSIMGTMSVWYISKLIQSSSYLEFLGRGSLVEYCFNYATLCLVANIFTSSLNSGGQVLFGESLVCLVISTVTINILACFYWLLSHRYVRVILGKF